MIQTIAPFMCPFFTAAASIYQWDKLTRNLPTSQAFGKEQSLGVSIYLSIYLSIIIYLFIYLSILSYPILSYLSIYLSESIPPGDSHLP